jgi:hypothetical protein
MAVLDRAIDFVTSSSAVEGATIAAIAAFLIFFLTRLTEIILIWVNRRGSRKRLVIGLFQEVRYNITQLDRFLLAKDVTVQMKKNIAGDLTYRPLVIGDDITQFYDAVAASLPDISPSCMMPTRVVGFAARLTHPRTLSQKVRDLRAVPGRACQMF